MVQNEISQGQVLAPLSAGRLDTFGKMGKNHTLGNSYTFSRGWMVDFDGFFFQTAECYSYYGSQPIQGGRLRARFSAKVLEKVAENSREKGKVPKEFWGEDGSR